jgi:signal transduction histidine kinase
VTHRARQKIAEQKKELESTLEQLKITQLQLVQSEKMASLGVFISGIAHEINNPVNFISMGVDGIEKVIEKVIALFAELNKLTVDSKGDEIQQLIELKQKLKFQRSLDALPEVLANIKIGITRTIAITNGLRLYARMDTEEKSLCDINQIIETALILIKPQLNSEIAIQANFGNLQQVKVFPGKLSQVFVNILGNAVDAIHDMRKSTKKHAISITTNEIEGIITIKFSDTGNGIPPEVLSKIFDPFYTTKEVGKGTGLGMSIATSIIEEHNGKISASNNADGGATFTIELPINNE